MSQTKVSKNCIEYSSSRNGNGNGNNNNNNSHNNTYLLKKTTCNLYIALIGENRRLVTDEPVEFEK